MSNGGFSYGGGNNGNGGNAGNSGGGASGGPPPNPWEGQVAPAPPPNPHAAHSGGSSGDADTMAIVSIGSGIGSLISMFCCCIPFVNYIAWLIQPTLAIAALVTGFIALRDQGLDSEHRTYAKIGIALSVVAIGMILLVLTLVVLVFAGAIAIPELEPLLDKFK